MRHLAAATVAVFSLMSGSSTEAASFLERQRKHSRVATAYDDRLSELQRLFADARAAWPPRELYLRAFKAEGDLELWAAAAASPDARLVRVKRFAVCAASGVPGPKVQAGDLQVPEGFYRVDRFNPRSRYHLSLGIDYPNARDRARTPRGKSPGGDIFIHGECVTIGCLPIENGPVELLYLAAVLARDAGQRHIPVHIFPCRMNERRCRVGLAAQSSPALQALWASLSEGDARFRRSGRPAAVRATRKGYVFEP